MDDRPSGPPQKTKPDDLSPLQQANVRRRRRFIGIIIAVVAVGAVAWWIKQAPTPQTGRGRFATGAPTPVLAEAAAKGDVDITINALGTVTSLATVTVVSQISGKITNVAFKEGQIVKPGDLLVQIDPQPYQLSLQQWQGQLAHDQALLAGAQVDLARYQKLAETKAIPEQQLDTQKYLVKQYEGTVTSDQAQVETQKLNIEYCHIAAPIAGIVGLRGVDIGNYVSPSSTTAITTITQLQPITVLFPVAEDNVGRIRQRLNAGAKLSTTAYDRSGLNELATGSVIATDSQIDTTTGTLKIKAQFANQDQQLFPNQFVNIRLLVDVLHDATVVPTSAVLRGANGNFVYLINADDTVAALTVQTGPTSGDRVAITSGLSPGDRVVTDGSDKLKDGAKVVVRSNNPPTNAAPANAAPAANAPDKPRRQRQQ